MHRGTVDVPVDLFVGNISYLDVVALPQHVIQVLRGDAVHRERHQGAAHTRIVGDVDVGTIDRMESITELLREVTIASLHGTLIAVEEKLLQLKITGTGQDRVRWPTKVWGRLTYLASVVAVADFPPTDQHREVHQVLRARPSAFEQELEQLMQNELPAFNRTLEDNGLPRIVTGGE